MRNENADGHTEVRGRELSEDKSLGSQLARLRHALVGDPADGGSGSAAAQLPTAPVPLGAGKLSARRRGVDSERSRAPQEGETAEVRSVVRALRDYVNRQGKKPSRFLRADISLHVPRPRLSGNDIERLRSTREIGALDHLLYLAVRWKFSPTEDVRGQFLQSAAEAAVLIRHWDDLLRDDDINAHWIARRIACAADEQSGTAELARIEHDIVDRLGVVARDSGTSTRDVGLYWWGAPSNTGVALSPDVEERIRDAVTPATSAQVQLVKEIQRIKAVVFSLIWQRVTPELSAITDQDAQLVCTWNDTVRSGVGVTTATDATVELLRAQFGVGREAASDPLAGRLLSARIAENQARAFYAAEGASVTDTSAEQINNESVRWRTHDLEVDGVPLDVKNSRRARYNPERFTSFLAREFKTDAEARAVRLVGVASYFVRPYSLLAPDDPYLRTRRPVILGETSDEAIQRCAREFPAIMDGTFREAADAKQHFPPWVFSYPDWVYDSRDRAFAEFVLLDLSALKPHMRGLLGVAALEIAAGIDDELAASTSLTSAQTEFVRLWRHVRARCGASVMSLYLTVLAFVLRRIRDHKDTAFDPATLRVLIFPDADEAHTFCPLGMWDPLQTVDTLISTLAELNNVAQDQLRDIREWKLQQLQILRGRELHGRWRTVLAYCHCGKAPLILGREEICQCGRLICPECGECGASHARL